MKIHTKHFISPQAKFDFNRFCLLPTINFSIYKTGKDFDENTDSEVTQKHRLLRFEWLFFSCGFIWMTAMLDKPFRAADLKSLKHKTNLGWRLFIAFSIIIAGMVISFISKNAQDSHFQYFTVCLALMMMLTVSMDRSDYLLDEYSDLSSTEDESVSKAIDRIIEMKTEIMILKSHNQLSEDMIAQLETEIIKLKSTPVPKKRAVKETVSKA